MASIRYPLQRFRAGRLTAGPGRSLSTQRGMTIIELMIALTVGLIILVGVLQVFSGTRQSMVFQQNMAALHDSARFGLSFLSRTIRMAAYRGDGPGEWVLGPMTGGTGLTGINNDADNTNNIKDGTDVITISYEGSTDGYVWDCLGVQVPAGTVSTNTFSISITDNLQCSTDGGTTNVSLVDGIENGQFLYGVDTDDDQAANQYVTIDNVTDTDEVVSVRIALLLATVADNLSTDTDNNNYVLLDSLSAAAGDMRVRRVISTTVRLRNRI